MYLGLDLGTSALKALLLAPDHRVVAQVERGLSVSTPHPLWSEQDPADWEAALLSALDELAEREPATMRAVRGIGLSGQMHGAVALDAAHRPLRPAILWNDGRSAAACAALDEACPHAPALTGNRAMPGFTAPKLLWMARHEPDLFARIALVLLPKDYLRLCLTGAAISDMSDASGTFWLDVGRRDWSDELLAVSGMRRKQMPDLAEGSDVAGRLRPALAARWGMGAEVIIAGGGGDNAASAVGMGIVRPGQGFLSLGTSGVIFRATEGFAPNAEACIHAFCHALPGRWHQMSVMLSAAASLRWVTRLTGRADEAALLAEIAALRPEERAAAPLFLPYLTGERTPHNSATARGAWLGLGQDHGPAALGYAVLEGVAFGLRDGLLALGEGAGAQGLLLVGGGSRSPLWNQMLADILGVPLHLAEGGEAAGALGAARLAWLADGGAEEEICRAPAVREVFSPQAGLNMARYQRFRAAFAASGL
nr:xylulokinase [uncultured Acidocella sp.]